LWVFDAGGRVGDANPGARLQQYRVQPGPEPLLMPEQTIELTSPRGGVLGVTREAVWLYVTPGHCERLSPGGLRLSALSSSEPVLPDWILPTQRLDQSLWLEPNGRVARV